VHVEKTDGETQTLAVHLIDANTEPMDDYRKIIEQAHLAMDEYNAMKFANDLMYEQMTENQRRYKVQLDSNKDELKEANNKAE
jgi:hypothetical protein